MLLQRGHGSILSGFFNVLSCDLFVSVASSLIEVGGLSSSLGSLGFFVAVESCKFNTVLGKVTIRGCV